MSATSGNDDGARPLLDGYEPPLATIVQRLRDRRLFVRTPAGWVDHAPRGARGLSRRPGMRVVLHWSALVGQVVLVRHGSPLAAIRRPDGPASALVGDADAGPDSSVLVLSEAAVAVVCSADLRARGNALASAWAASLVTAPVAGPGRRGACGARGADGRPVPTGAAVGAALGGGCWAEANTDYLDRLEEFVADLRVVGASTPPKPGGRHRA